jgi:hypothetical protein
MKAKYYGTCTVCKDPIEPGDEVELVEDTETWVHEECAGVVDGDENAAVVEQSVMMGIAMEMVAAK